MSFAPKIIEQRPYQVASSLNLLLVEYASHGVKFGRKPWAARVQPPTFKMPRKAIRGVPGSFFWVAAWGGPCGRVSSLQPRGLIRRLIWSETIFQTKQFAEKPRQSEGVVIQFLPDSAGGLQMRGRFHDQGGMFSYLQPEKRIPANHPLRKIRELVREVLKELNHTFGRLYAQEGRPSIPPEQLLSALLLQVLYSVRSERQLMEQLDYNLLFRWFVGLSPDDPIWDPTVFTKNRERLQEGDVFEKFMTKLLNHEKVKPLLSDEHFSVDGTLIEAWASHKSFKPKQAKKDDDGSNFHGQVRKNDTHQSTTDPEAKLYRKAGGREAKLSYLGHALMENRNGLAVGGMVTPADGTAERRASQALLKKQAKGSKRITVGEDKAYDTSDHIAALRRMNVTPHVAQNDNLTKTGKRRSSAIDARTTRHIGYQISQTCRKMAECIFGWGKQHGTMRKTKHRGIAAVSADFMLNLIAYNLVRIPKLIAA